MCGLQISQLSASTRQARMRSTVELLGRKQLAPGEELPLTPADPASRILEALLNVQIRPSACRCFLRRCKLQTQPHLLQRYSFKVLNLGLPLTPQLLDVESSYGP